MFYDHCSHHGGERFSISSVNAESRENTIVAVYMISVPTMEVLDIFTLSAKCSQKPIVTVYISNVTTVEIGLILLLSMCQFQEHRTANCFC